MEIFPHPKYALKNWGMPRMPENTQCMKISELAFETVPHHILLPLALTFQSGNCIKVFLVYNFMIIYINFPSLALNTQIRDYTFYSRYVIIMYKRWNNKTFKGYTYLFESTYQPYFLVRIPLPEPRLVGRWRVTPGRSQSYTSLMQLPAQHHSLRYKVGG